MQGEVHVLRLSMRPVESVEDLRDAVTMACAASEAPELRDLDFGVDVRPLAPPPIPHPRGTPCGMRLGPPLPNYAHTHLHPPYRTRSKRLPIQPAPEPNSDRIHSGTGDS